MNEISKIKMCETKKEKNFAYKQLTQHKCKNKTNIFLKLEI